MGKGRLEAFSDGVIAVIITVMVLEMKVPHGTDLEALAPIVPVFVTYVLSFVYVATYGVVLMCAGIAYYLLAHCLVSTHGRDSAIARSLGADVKGKISVVIYAVAIPLAFVRWWLAFALYVLVAAIWFVPDTRIEKRSGQ